MQGLVILNRVVEWDAALPAAGAQTNQAATALPFGTSTLAYWIRYVATSATGRPAFQLDFQNGDGLGEYTESLEDSGSLFITGTNGVITLYSEALTSAAPGGIGAVWQTVFVFDKIPPLTTFARLRANEAGDAANPGVLTMAVTGWGHN